MSIAQPAVSLRNVRKCYAVKGRRDVLALDEISFDVAEGEFVALVGPSGCGKSTLIKIISGLLPITNGTLRVFGAPVASAVRNVGIVFQSPVLMKWRTIFENVKLPLELLGKTDPNIDDRVMSLLELTGIRDFAESYPRELSGGMQQRASICRALVHDPRLLLLDEPFGALDSITRSQMNVELAAIWARTRKTTVLITHSISEAVFLADRVVVLSARPSRVTETIDVTIPRPRKIDVRRTAKFNETVQLIESYIGIEFA